MTTRSWRYRSSAPTSDASGPDRRLLTLVGAVFGVAGVVLVVVTAVLGWRTWSWQSDADRVEGSVVALHEHRDDDGSLTFRPEVEYTADGEIRRFTSSTGTNPSAYDVGEDIEVAVDPDDPGDARLTGWTAYLPPLVTGVLGVAFTAVGGGLLVLRRRTRRAPGELPGAGSVAPTWLPAWGEVVELARPRSGDRTARARGPVNVTVVWTDPAGIEQLSVSAHPDPGVELGDRIRLFADPADPTDVTFDWNSVGSEGDTTPP
ncbi:DUF3592 domain-containing protein [Nocardioides insulae]|uniref:DUF3592 domain-containing protein n=1 Tax=Nocardioides insulae TaxID=394734 RepID=UPI0003F4D421|nr:DUF3592 domain-containing protein [Nocardioides insulae]